MRKWAKKEKRLLRLELEANEQDIIYDRFGAVRLRILDNNQVITWAGQHIGYLAGNALHNNTGQHIGWYEGGVIRDLAGFVVGFGVSPTDSPLPYLPYKQYLPYRGYVQYAPYRPYSSYLHYKPYKMFGWSSLDPVTLFKGAGK